MAIYNKTKQTIFTHFIYNATTISLCIVYIPDHLFHYFIIYFILLSTLIFYFILMSTLIFYLILLSILVLYLHFYLHLLFPFMLYFCLCFAQSIGTKTVSPPGINKVF